MNRKKEHDEYLDSLQEIYDIALMNGDLKSALNAKKLQADWLKEKNKKEKTKGEIGIKNMSNEDLEQLIAEIEQQVQGE